MIGRKIDWSDILIAILFFVAAIFVFINPQQAFDVITLLFGAILIIHGALQVINYFRFKGNDLAKGLLWISLIVGIIEIIAGIVIIANPLISQTVLTWGFLAWFLFIFVSGLFRIGFLRLISNTLFWIALIINILGIILAFSLIANPFQAYLTIPTIIGILFILAGANSLFNAFDER